MSDGLGVLVYVAAFLMSLLATMDACYAQAVRHEETRSGASSGAIIVATAQDIRAIDGHLYLAAISTKPYRPVNSVSGLGLTWRRLVAQCSGRAQTGIEIWMALGVPSDDGPVKAKLARAPNNVVIVVSRYSNVDLAEPIGSLVSGNTRGVDGQCSGGTDSPSYTLPLDTKSPGSLVYGVAAMRNRSHQPGTEYMERAEVAQGSFAGRMAGLAVIERSVVTPVTVAIDGRFNRSVDWAVAGLELRPVGSSVPKPDIAVTPAAGDYRSVVVNAGVAKAFEVSNEGTADLNVNNVEIVGAAASEFRLQGVKTPFSLLAGQREDFVVRFEPVSTGAKISTLRFRSDDSNEDPFDAPLTGRGVATQDPDIAINPRSYDYGAVMIKRSAPASFEVSNQGVEDLIVTSVTLKGADAPLFAGVGGSAPFTLASGETQNVAVSFSPTWEARADATLQIVSNDPVDGMLAVALTGRGRSAAGPGEMWISAKELTSRPMSGSAWNRVKATADGDLGTAEIADVHSKHDVRTLAVALVYARTGNAAYRRKAVDAIISAIGTDEGGTAAGLARNGASYIISAGLIGLADYKPQADAALRRWLDATRFVVRSDGTLIEEDEERANNHGRYAGATRVAIGIYLGEQAEIERAAQVFKGFLGDRETYDGFLWKRGMTWQADPTQPVGINRLGAMKDGYSVDGALTEEMRRGCEFQLPPCYTQYPWEGLQGILIEAVLLSRQGYDVFNWEDQAILRAVRFLDRLRVQFPQDPWWAVGDDTFLPWLVNSVYGTDFPTDPTRKLGDIMGWTDWTHGP